MLTRVRWLSDFYFNNLWFRFLKILRNQRSSGSGIFENFPESKNLRFLSFLKKPPRTSGFHEITGKEFTVL
jgi:hypothetical protein